MRTATATRNDYAAALERLTSANRDAHDLAGLIDYFARILRGGWPDPDGPPLEAFPTAGQVRRTFERRTEALAHSASAWERLSFEYRELLTPPVELG